ncbi:MAG: hypothetical protein WBS24_03400 [Terriglobales bacterium]
MKAHADYVGPAADWGKPTREYVDSLHDWHEWPPTSWRVRLDVEDRSFALDFHQGSAHRKPPTAATVLDCVLSDAQAGVETFEDFAAEMGYDSDSRKAEATWRACKDTALAVRVLLGDKYQTIEDVRAELGEIPEPVE